MKMLSNLLISAGSSLLSCWFFGAGFSDTAIVTTAVPAMVICVWQIGYAVGKHFAKSLPDEAWLSRGVCPVCTTAGTLTEVSSSGLPGVDRSTIAQCDNCLARFDIRTGENGPIVLRIGKADGGPDDD